MLPDPTILLIATAFGSTRFVDYLPLLGAALALLSAVGIAWWNAAQTRRDRRRDLYSAAYKSVVSWAELYYRVRRRDPAKPYELVALFHEVQEAIDYHDGWISIESPELARAYRMFAAAVKRKTGPAIKRAWAEEPCDPKNGFTPPDGDGLPGIEDEKRQFLADVNDHLSLSLERHLALNQRHPEPRRSHK
jgi:hypothetical protein